MSAILAIDQGTSGTKSIVVDEDDRVLATVEVPIHPRYLQGGGVEQDPEELWNSVLETAKQALAEAKVPLGAVTLTNQGETVLAWDLATGEPHSDLIVWQDSRSQGICDELQEHADMLAQRTGLVLDPYFTAPKLTWLRRNGVKDGVVSTSDSWMLNKLTGQYVTDITTASRSLLKALPDRGWDSELLELFGLADEQAPQIVANDQVIGTTDLFGSEVPVAGIVVDQQAALLAESCLAPGEAKCTFGTGAFLLINAGDMPKASTCGLATSTAWDVDGTQTYCYDGQVYTAASAIRWLINIGIITEAADLDRMGSDEPSEALFVPALAGLAAPWWRSDAKASLSGISLATSRADLVTAVMFGLAANVAELAKLSVSDSGQPISKLRVDGGLTRSTKLMQIVANLTQAEVETYSSPHATPLGAVALARKSLDPQRPLADCVPKWQPSASYQPTWSQERTDEYLDSWASSVSKAIELS